MNKIIYKHSVRSFPQADISITGDTVTISKGEQSFILSTIKKLGDGDVYLDFSVIDIYREALKKTSCGEIEIKLIEGEGILLDIGMKIFIPGYHDSIYYSSDMILVIEYSEKGILIERKEIDMKEGVYNYS